MKAGNNVSADPPGEDTPLLSSTSSGQLGESSERSNSGRHVTFRRTSVTLRSSQNRRPSNAALLRDRKSVRTMTNLFPGALEEGDDEDQDGDHQKCLKLVDALAPLVAGGVIVATNGYTTVPHPPSTIKSLPAFAPFRRKARHRSFTLWWINEFRHWWKSR